MEVDESPQLLVVTAEAALLERVLSVTATLGVEPEVVADPVMLRSAWLRAPLVLVGVDVAADVVALVLPVRRGVFLVGLDDALGEVCAWSVPLGAAVLPLPSGADGLAAAVAEGSGRRSRAGRLVAVIGGAGGVGSSTCATGLAVVGARLGWRTALVDVDEKGGGLDLLVGAEGDDGWRWPRFAGASGFLGDLHGQLPHSDGVDVLSVAREAPPGVPIGAEQLRAVLLSVGRTHDLVVADLPRTLTPACREGLRQADQVLLVVRADLRGIAAARALLQELLPACVSLHLLVREGRVRGVRPDAVAAALGLPCAGTLPHDAGLVLAAERGDPPGRSPRSMLARSCRQVLEGLAPAGVPA
ncbi:MAG: septum site-determining protein Ssd [Friedmanniella sp.]